MSQVFDFWFCPFAFFKFSEKLVLVQLAKYPTNVVEVLLSSLGEDEDVIKIHHEEGVVKQVEDLIHQMLE